MVNIVVAKQSVALRDARGHVGRMGFYYQYDNSGGTGLSNATGHATAIYTAMAAMSNGSIIGTSGLIGELWEPNVYGGASVFSSAEDKARLVFLGLNDDVSPVLVGLVAYEIPAPKEDIFYADGETVNPAATEVAAFIAAIIAADANGGHAVSKSGLLIGSFVGGVRKRRKLQRKLTIWDKSPNLDEPEE